MSTDLAFSLALNETTEAHPRLLLPFPRSLLRRLLLGKLGSPLRQHLQALQPLGRRSESSSLHAEDVPGHRVVVLCDVDLLHREVVAPIHR